MKLRLRAVAAALLLVVGGPGCGHSVDPVAPFDSSAAIPAPRNVLAQPDPIGRLVVTWSATAGDRTVVDGWFVERRTTAMNTFTRLTTAAIVDTAYFDDDVVDDLRYVYRVIAVTGAGITGVPVETIPVRGDRTAPATPTAVAASTTPGGVLLQFADGGEPDLSFFEVQVTLTQTNLPPQFRQVTGSPATLTGLVGGNEYAFAVAAVDSAGRISAFSTPPATAIAGP